MATVANKLMTAEEFYDFANRPENRDRDLELERGEVIELSKPGKRHGLVCANIVMILHAFAAKRKKGYPCANDTGVVVERDPDTVRGPDVLFFEDATSFAEVDEKYGERPPLLAVEVLSPNDTYAKITRRVSEQLNYGTPLVWVVDPEAENVTIHRAGADPDTKYKGDELSGLDVLPDLRLNVQEFFQLPGQ